MRTPWQKDTVSWLLLGAGIVCLALALLPGWSVKMDPAPKSTRSEFTLGLPSSPFYFYRHFEGPNRSFRFESGLQVFSWSTLLLIAGYASVKAYGIRRRDRGEPAAASTSQGDAGIS